MADEKKELTKAQKLEEIRKKMEKDFGKGILMGAKDKSQYHQAISTGSLGLNKALGIGGLPKGRIVEIYGPESSGKTTMCLHTIAEAHKADPETFCAFVDVEHAIDTKYAEQLGVDLDRLKISQPDYGEQALEIADRLVESGLFAVVVVDSVAALVPKAELEGEMGDNKLGLHARLMSQAMRKMTASVSKTNTLCIFINQMREKIGVMFGSPETTTGGNALKFYASVRLDIRRQASDKDAIKDGETRIGNPTTVKVIKNKLAPPFTKATFNILYGQGVDSFGELIDMAVETGVVNKSGSWFSYGDTKIGQGIDSVSNLLRDNDDLFNEIKNKVMESYLPKQLEVKEIVDAESEV